MTLPNDPFDFLWRSDADEPRPTGGRTPGDTPRPGSNSFPNRAEPSKHFEPDLDAFFDDDLSDDESELLYEHIRSERELAAEMFGTQRALEALRSTPRCPDFSQRILQQVDRKRGLLSGPWLQRVFVGRVAIAACLLLAMGGIFALHRASPELATMGQPTPIGQLASAVPADASRSQRSGDAGASGWTAGLNIENAAMDSRAALHARSIMQAGPETRRVLVEAGETLPMGGDGVVFANPSGGVSDGMIVSSASQIAVEFPGLQGLSIVHDASHETAFQAMLAQQPMPPPMSQPMPMMQAAPMMASATMASGSQGPASFEPHAAPHAATVAVVPAADISGSVDAYEPRRSARASATRKTGSRPAQPIVTDDCVYYMGRVMDRRSFQTVLAGFTAMAPVAFD